MFPGTGKKGENSLSINNFYKNVIRNKTHPVFKIILAYANCGDSLCPCILLIELLLNN